MSVTAEGDVKGGVGAVDQDVGTEDPQRGQQRSAEIALPSSLKAVSGMMRGRPPTPYTSGKSREELVSSPRRNRPPRPL
jgi:hypothetical protein